MVLPGEWVVRGGGAWWCGVGYTADWLAGGDGGCMRGSACSMVPAAYTDAIDL